MGLNAGKVEHGGVCVSLRRSHPTHRGRQRGGWNGAFRGLIKSAVMQKRRESLLLVWKSDEPR